MHTATRLHCIPSARDLGMLALVVASAVGQQILGVCLSFITELRIFPV
jgi:hypothetical protein